MLWWLGCEEVESSRESILSSGVHRLATALKVVEEVQGKCKK